MIYILMAMFASVIVLLDQLSKHWTVTHIAAYECTSPRVNCAEHIAKLQELYHIPEQTDLPSSAPAVKGVFELTHYHNTGAAWSSFEGQTWLFVLVFAIFAGFMIWEFPKKRMGFRQFERWCLVAVFAGGLGNIIDRLRLGFVVDMIDLDFMSFPVFNVADCFICCGCIALMFHLIFFNKEFWKDEEKDDSTADSGSGGGETRCLSDPDCGGPDQSEGAECYRGGTCDPAGEDSQEERQV